MELLQESKCLFEHGKLLKEAFKNAVLQSDLFERTRINEDGSKEKERADVIKKIRKNEFVRNDYKAFLNHLEDNKRNSFLSHYSVEDFENDNVQTFELRDYEIGYALKPMQNGDVDIISVHNNEPGIGGIGKELIQSAIRNGGTTLDHFDGFLSNLYGSMGFKEYDRYNWDEQYAPKNWDYKTYGTPDVVMRRLKK